MDARRECYGEDHRIRDVYSPSDFQREILKLSFEDFITKTNIKDLILKEQRKMRNDENLVLQTAAMHPQLEFFYEYRKRTVEWHKNCMKNLQFIPSPVERRPEPEPNRDQSSDANKNLNAKKTTEKQTVPEPLPSTSSPKKTTKMAKKSKKKVAPKLNDFQREVKALSYDAFVNETNIRDIVAQDFRNQFQGTKKMTDYDWNFGLTHYERVRNNDDITEWYKTSMTNLKFKVCDCKRNKQFEDKSVATEQEVVETRAIGCATDPDDQQIELQLHAIHESQIICFANFSAEASELHLGQEANVEDHQGKPSQLHSFDFIDLISIEINFC